MPKALSLRVWVVALHNNVAEKSFRLICAVIRRLLYFAQSNGEHRISKI
jgi:hypothetical protein